MVIDGAKVFIKNDVINKYLLVLRDDLSSIPEPNTWALIGGGIETGETPYESLVREISEELNIEIFNIDEICRKPKIHIVNGQKYPVIGYYFVAKTNVIDIDSIHLTEGQRLRYFSKNEIMCLSNVSVTIHELFEAYPGMLD